MMKSISKKIFKILAGITGILIILVFFVYFFIQTEKFNTLALEITLDKLNENSQTTGVNFDLDSIQGNILEGLILIKGSIKINEENLFTFDSIELKYDLWGLLEHEIRVKYLKICSPEINLTKIKDSKDSTVWNFSKLFSSSNEPDTSQSAFDWGVVIGNTKIENGRLNVKGQLFADTPGWRLQNRKMEKFDFNNLEVENIELEFNGKYFPDNKNIKIKNLSFKTNSDFNVKRFTMNSRIDMNNNFSELDALELITDKSDIKIGKGKLSDFNPFDSSAYKNLGSKNIEADINISKFNFADLKFFVPSVDMLDSTVGLGLNVSGKYGDLDINRLNLSLPNSEINLSGKIKKLDFPADMIIDIEVKDSKIFPKDVKTIVKINSIPDYGYIGPVYPEITYTGTYENFYSKFNILTSAGYVTGNINLDLTNKKYNGRIVTSNLDPGKIFKDNSIKGNINIAADFSGKGFDPRSINANVKYTMGHSYFAGYDIKYSGGNVSLNNSNIALNIRHNSSVGNFNIKGIVNISNIKNPSYKLSGNVSNLNIAGITRSSGDNSNLNFSFSINGRGISPENLNGIYNISMLHSQYGSIEIPETEFVLAAKNNLQENSMNLISDFADLNVEGKFKIEQLINVLKQNVDAISRNISEKLMLKDSSVISNPENTDNKNFNLTYSFIVKDSAKTNLILSRFNVAFNGKVSGQIENGSNGFVSKTILNASSFTYEDTAIVLKDFSSEMNLTNEQDNLTVNFKSTADKILIDSLAFDSVKVSFNLNNSKATLSALVKQDSAISGKVKGEFIFYDDSIVVSADTVLLAFKQYKVQNKGSLVLKYDKEAIDINKMILQSNGAVMNVSGKYSFNSVSDILLEGNNMKISDFRKAITAEDDEDTKKKQTEYAEGMLKEFLINYKGTPENPELNLKLVSTDIFHEKESIGKVDLSAEYKNNNILLNFNIIASENSGKISITGNMPFQNPLSDSVKSQITNGQVSLIFNAENFHYKNFLELIPGIPEISGILNGGITVTGVASSPELKGSLKITDGSYFLDFTGMNYNFELNAKTENSKLVLDNLKFYNEFDKARHIDLFGTIDFAGMKLNEIDLRSSGDMILLNKDIEKNMLGVYGYILGGIGTPPLTIKGNAEKLKIRGQIIVSDATISSVPTGGSGYDLTGDNFKYILETADMSKNLRDSSILIPEKDYNKIDPFEKSKYKISKSRSYLADFLDIDINVKTTRNIYASIDFKNLTRARLFGEMKGNLKLKTVDNILNVTGNVDVVGNSYFKFYKNFELKDSKIKFVGPIDNPVLDIQAVHTGTKVSEQYGNSTSTEVQVKLSVTGTASKPVTKLSLIEDGSEITGTEAQSDAVSYLLFGRYKSELTSSERTSVATAIGTSFVSSYVSQALREVFPFLIDAAFNYTEGKVKDSDIQLISEFGDATVTVGGKILKDIKNFEFSVDYPLNKFFEWRLPEKMMLEFYREELDDNIGNETETTMNTGLKIIYKIKF